MTIVRKLARPLLAASFIYNGVNRLRTPESAKHLKPVIDAAAKASPQLAPLRGQERLIGQAISATQVGAGALFALGRFPRLSSTLLLVTGSIDAYVEYVTAESETKEQKNARIAQGVKSASLVGAVALTSVDTEGNPSLAWRANKLGSDVKKKSSKLSDDLKKKSEDVFNN
ncbi:MULTISPECIES: DoxX family protein [Micrococcales]|uniref:DoxX family protein n=1 Tax=Micrococcales TaxID=85006 RepID=UPI000569771E|nr:MULTISPECIES: DoxX family membrane protein [Micrococcales]